MDDLLTNLPQELAEKLRSVIVADQDAQALRSTAEAAAAALKRTEEEATRAVAEASAAAATQSTAAERARARLREVAQQFTEAFARRYGPAS